MSDIHRGVFGAFAGHFLGGGIGGIVGGGVLAGPHGAVIGAGLEAADKFLRIISDFAARPIERANARLRAQMTILGTAGAVVGTEHQDRDWARYVPLLDRIHEGNLRRDAAKKERLEIEAEQMSRARPGLAQRMQMSADDLAAVMGRRHVGHFENLERNTRLYADIQATLQEGINPDAPGAKGKGNERLKELLASLKNNKVGLTAEQEHGFRAELEQLMGKRLTSSVGAAAREIQFSDPDSAAKQVYQAAYRSGVPSDPNQKTAEATGSMNNTLNTVLDFLQRTFGSAGGASDAVQNAR